MRKSRTLINSRDLTRCPVLLLLRIVMASLAGSVDIKSLIVDACGNLLDTLSTFSHFLWLNFLEIAVLQQLAHILGMDSGLPFFVFSTTKVLQMFVKILKKLVPETFGFSFVKFSHSQLFPLPTLPTSNSSHFQLFPLPTLPQYPHLHPHPHPCLYYLNFHLHHPCFLPCLSLLSFLSHRWNSLLQCFSF